MDLSSLVGKVKQAAQGHPDAVRGGLDRVQQVVDEKTGGKYSEQVKQGREGLEGALGVPGRAKEAFKAEASADEGRPEPMTVDPIDPPAPIDEPGSEQGR